MLSSAVTLELKASKESAHSNAVPSVAFSPDGKTIISGSWDETIKVWDAGEPFQFLCLSFSLPHLALLPAESLTLMKEKQNAHAEKYGQSILDVKFSPDGSKIVSCGVDQTIKVWDLIFWSREHHLLFSQATQRCVVLLLWLNKHKLQLPEEILDMLIRACI